MASTYTCLLYHFVFSTKERHPWFTPDIRTRVHPYLGGVIKSFQAVPLAVGGVEDHVHMLVQAHQQSDLAGMMRSTKASSSRWIRKTFAIQDFGWQNGYGVFTVSASQKARVVRYIEHQEKHHRTRSFQEELELLLKAHEVEYDPKYLL